MAVIFWIWYYRLLFKRIPNFSNTKSLVVAVFLLLSLVFLGMIITWNKRRNNLSVFVNTSLPLATYAVITYMQFILIEAYIVFAVGIVLSLAYSWCMLSCEIKNKAKKKTITRKRLLQAALATRTIIACCLSSLMIYLCLGSAFGIMSFSPTEKAQFTRAAEGTTIENNIDAVIRLDENTWSGLTPKEKLNTLQTIANIESYYLGLPHKLRVTVGILSEETLACYNDRTHTITININHLECDKAHSILDSLCHEARHAYRHRLCDLYNSINKEHKELLLFYDVQLFDYEFNNYVDGKTDAEGYFDQACERDARSYAYYACFEYYNIIVRRSLRLCESSFFAYLTFLALSHRGTPHPHAR